MRFKLDENLPVELAEKLIANGHDAFTIIQQNMQGTNDENLIRVCKKESRALITLDTDFSDIRKYPPKEYTGILVIRTINQSKLNMGKLIDKILPELKREKIEHSLWIVEDNKIRIR